MSLAPKQTATPSATATATTESDPVLSPTVRRAGRKALPWIVGAVAIVIAGLVIVAIRGAGADGGIPLAADNPAPAGAMAVVEVLKQQGVDVVVSNSVAQTERVVDDPADTTILFADDQQLLTTEQRRRLADLGTDLVIVTPDTVELGDLMPGVTAAGRIDGQFSAGCDLSAARNAGTVSASGSSYAADDSADATACFSEDSGHAGVVQIADGARTITALGFDEVLANGTTASDGNAALALNLLGENRTLVWYLSTSDDVRETTPATLAELTPGWVTPLAILLLLTAAAAAFWRGRRMGPLVIENLPVVVRASETMEGRARLYERGNARLHALDALRIGAVERLARANGLSRTATVGEVVDATASLTGRDRASVAAILVDAVPTTDSELVHLSDALLTLEDDTLRASRSH